MIIAEDMVLLKDAEIQKKYRKDNVMKYEERVKKAKKFISKNKLFTVIAVIAMCYLFSNFLFSQVNSDSSDDIEMTEIIENENSETQTISAEESIPNWQFYWSDLIVFAGAGGFCTIMIIRERKKERDNLE